MNDVAERAFRDHYANVVAFLRGRTRTSDEAEELAQAVFAQAAERLRANSRAPVAAWLYTVARRRLVDEARRRARRGGGDLSLDELAVATPEPRYGSEVARALHRALARLPDAQRRVVVGRLIEGKSFAEIAAAQGASEAACKMRFLRGLEAVRTLFEEEGLTP